MRGKCLMIQGTGSSVGKSLLCCGLLRVLRQDGYSVAPFKAQNMALNSFVTSAGLEMGRAQVTQAQAAGLAPDVRMNPVLLKPTSDRRSQVIVNGRPIGSMTASEYHEFKPRLSEDVRKSYESLESEHDFIIIEGAGSPAEINLRKSDIVNMAMAEMADAPVLLVGDINLGGVFAAILGTVMLVSDAERQRIRGYIINKFRGDVRLLTPGLQMLTDRIDIPCMGVVPWMPLDLEDEDSVTERFERQSGQGNIRVRIVRLPHISNFTDFQPLAMQPSLNVAYAKSAGELMDADLILLPGTKNTIEDLLCLREMGMDRAILRHAEQGGLVMGVCGGYQMLGKRILDPDHVESALPETEGLGLLDMEVVFEKDKTTVQSSVTVADREGVFGELSGLVLEGYEIHAGKNRFGKDAVPVFVHGDGSVDGIRNERGNVLGTYLHGIFDSGHMAELLARKLCREGDETASVITLADFREREFDRLAAMVRSSLHMDAVYRELMGERP